MKKLNIQTTAIGNSYWSGNGLYQEDYNRLTDELIPAEGKAETFKGEVLRCATNLTYEYYNNGNCNAHVEDTMDIWHTCQYCGGDGCSRCDDDGGYYDSDSIYMIEPKFEEMLETIRRFFSKRMPDAIEILDRIEDLIVSDHYSFSADEERPYVLMMDVVLSLLK